MQKPGVKLPDELRAKFSAEEKIGTEVAEKIKEAAKLQTILNEIKNDKGDLSKEPRSKIKEVIEILDRAVEMHQINKWIMEETGLKELYGQKLEEINALILENLTYKYLLEDYLSIECTIRAETKRDFLGMKLSFSGSGGLETKDESIYSYTGNIDAELKLVKSEIKRYRIDSYTINNMIVIRNGFATVYLISERNRLEAEDRILFDILMLVGQYRIKNVVAVSETKCLVLFYNEIVFEPQVPSKELYIRAKKMLNSFHSFVRKAPILINFYAEDFKLLASLSGNNYESLILRDENN